MFSRKIPLFLILSFFVFSKVFANCNKDNYEDFINAKKLESISIETNKSRKWAKNYFEALRMATLPNQPNQIRKQFKNKFKSKIQVKFTNGLNCSFKGAIRIHGDSLDHLEGVAPIPSLDVKLKDGNINQIVKFKLFIPHTRNAENEIFTAFLFKKLGFLSPETYYVPVAVNGVKTTLLFQEKLSKEFLERNLLREAPIIEGDERWMGDSALFQRNETLAKISNSKWITKGPLSYIISREGLKAVNQKYLINHLDSFDFHFDRLLQPVNEINSQAYNNEITFNALSIAIGSSHGLTLDDSRFYFDPMSNTFMPIYYDGNPQLLKFSNLFDPLKIISKDISLVTEHEVKGSKLALNLISSIDKKLFLEDLDEMGLNFSRKKIDEIIDGIISNLNSIQTAKVREDFDEEKYKPYYSFTNDPNLKLLFDTENINVLEVCDFNALNCYYKNVDLQYLSNALGASSSKKEIYIGDKKSYLNPSANLKIAKLNSTKILDNHTIYYTGNPSILYSNDTKTITFQPSSPDDRVVFNKSKLENYKIIFKKNINSLKSTNTQRFNEKLLTGCLSFIDSDIKSVQIEIDSPECEDGVNFVRAKGIDITLSVHDAMSDAVDADFSHLVFDSVNIKTAGNDCLDFSTGKYRVNNAELHKCGDKAFSVGEASSLDINNAVVSNSAIGVASKDSSKVNIKKINFINTQVCLTAYRKKQEFWGGKITYNIINCPIEKFNFEKGSEILKSEL